MNVSKLFFENNLLMAPIAGFTNAGFRAVALLCGAGLAFTEMVSAKGLIYGNENSKTLLYTTDLEKHPAAQIFGSDPEIIKKAVESEALEKFELIDINMGCPVPKIVKNKEGSALLENINLASEIIFAAKEGAKNKIVSAKMRIGVSEKNINAVEMAKALERAGADFITVHGRTREQMYSGKVNYDAIREVKQNVSVPVVGNGDVTDFASYNEMLIRTGADAVMVGRAALKNPNIFAYLLDEEEKYTKKELFQKIASIMLSYMPSEVVCNNLKKQLAYFAVGMIGNKIMKTKAFAARSVEELIEIL